MKRIVIGIVATAIAFAVLVNVLPSSMVSFKGDAVGLLGLAVVFGLVNAFIGPIVRLLSFPISMLTLGLVGFVINAALLLLTAWAAHDVAKIDFTVGGFPTSGITADTLIAAVVASVVLSIISTIVGLVVRD